MSEPISRPSRAIGPKKLHLIMRDNTMVEGSIHIGDEQSLLMYLATRKAGWMNMVGARRPKVTEPASHVVLQVDHIVMASAPDGNVDVIGKAAGMGERHVEIVLLGGTAVRGTLLMAPMQRVSDYLSQSGKFIGVRSARLGAEQRELGDVAIHSAAIAMMREAAPGATAIPAET